VTIITALWRNRPYSYTVRKEAAMRQTLTIAIVATLLVATVFEVIAAGGKTVVARNHYAAPASGISIAVPASMKSFPTELLAQ
jgi:hypothetical protein